MYRVRAAGIILAIVWIAAVGGGQEAPPTQTPPDADVSAGAPSPLLPGESRLDTMPCESDADVDAPVLGGGNLAESPGAREGSDAGPSSSFLSRGTVQVHTSNLVALGIVVGLSFGGAAGLAASRLAGLRPRAASRLVAPAAPLPGTAPAGPPAAIDSGATAIAKQPPTSILPPPTHLGRLVASVKANPMDGESHFDLALELMRRNEVGLGIRHLSTSFTLYPQGVLRLLEDPTLVKIREHPEVVFALRTLHREQQRRFTGYV